MYMSPSLPVRVNSLPVRVNSPPVSVNSLPVTAKGKLHALRHAAMKFLGEVYVSCRSMSSELLVMVIRFKSGPAWPASSALPRHDAVIYREHCICDNNAIFRCLINWLVFVANAVFVTLFSPICCPSFLL